LILTLLSSVKKNSTASIVIKIDDSYLDTEIGQQHAVKICCCIWVALVNSSSYFKRLGSFKV